MSQQVDEQQEGTSRVVRLAGVLGGKLGVAVIIVGLVVIFLGWNGAASFNDLRQQFPYLISGGVAGLALVVIGAALLVVDGARSDRVALQASMEELRRTVEGMAAVASAPSASAVSSDVVVLGSSSFHRPDCRMVQGRDMPHGDRDEAAAAGKTACRICSP